ncbi:hypothetical protein [Azospirillum argentinense]|uniref:DNA 3'-5' helicase II n=1 Tax=Azospirillum argentinense TaxID=2970906 RepID=A0A5B0KRG2_9PROT|nr:hypothetical protein [Azospirillum argentinense]KAA1054436.1 hypothetical protein FH063_006692 [Azospirillum argentinense]
MLPTTYHRAQAEAETLDALATEGQEAVRELNRRIRSGAERVQRGEDPERVQSDTARAKAQLQGWTELQHTGYGKVIYLRGSDGRLVSWRIGQANISVSACGVVNRNAPVVSLLIHREPGDTVTMQAGGIANEYEVVAVALCDHVVGLDGGPLEPNFVRVVVDDAAAEDIDLIQDLKASLRRHFGATATVDVVPAPEAATAPEDPYWQVVLQAPVSGIYAEEAGLSGKFMTRTTENQEEALRTVRGIVAVQGVAGSGKTSVALGRLKYLANFRTGESADSSLPNPEDFDPGRMMGFVLSPSLRQYLKSTADDLHLTGMHIVDIQEYVQKLRIQRGVGVVSRFEFLPPVRRDIGAASGTMDWLRGADEAVAPLVAEVILPPLREMPPRPDDDDGRRIVPERWLELARATFGSRRFSEHVGRLEATLTAAGPGNRFRMEELAAQVDALFDVLDHAITDFERVQQRRLAIGERPALRTAMLGRLVASLRRLRLEEFYVEAVRTGKLASALSARHASEAAEALTALSERFAATPPKLAPGDLVTILSLYALASWGFARRINEISHVTDMADRMAVFIDEVQDFSEQETFLMAAAALPRYSAITTAGDIFQRLTRGAGTPDACFPLYPGARKSVSLTINKRQSKLLADLSLAVRQHVLGDAQSQAGLPGVPARVWLYSNADLFADELVRRILSVPEGASVAVVLPDMARAGAWYQRCEAELTRAGRQPTVSQKSDLVRLYHVHFTSAYEAKGLEFDVTLVPDLNAFDLSVPEGRAALYVATSRPRGALLLAASGEQLASGFGKLEEAGYVTVVPWEG